MLARLDRSTRWLLGWVIIIALMPVIAPWFPAVEMRAENPTLHDLYKFLHVLGAVLFVGNIIVTGLWMYLSERSKQVAIIAFAARAVNWMDVAFTAPGVALVLLTGFIQAPHHGGVFTESWITAGLILFALSGVVWLAALIPDQERMIRLSREPTKPLPTEFFQTLHHWYAWGLIAILLPLGTLFLMIYQPKLW